MTKPGTSRWNVSAVVEARVDARFRKFSAATGDDSVNRPMTMSPFSVVRRTPVPSPDGTSGGSAMGVAWGGANEGSWAITGRPAIVTRTSAAAAEARVRRNMGK